MLPRCSLAKVTTAFLQSVSRAHPGCVGEDLLPQQQEVELSWGVGVPQRCASVLLVT